MRKPVSTPCMDATMPQREYPYGRTSDPKQRKGDGHARQDDYAAELAAEHGWHLDDTYQFADRGRSGFHGDHLGPKGHLTRFLAMVKSGQITPGSVLAIENLDRLSRQDVDIAYDVFREILKAGIWIATKTPPRIYKRESCGLMDLMEPIWLMYLAHEESSKKSNRLIDKWKRRRERARTSLRCTSCKTSHSGEDVKVCPTCGKALVGTPYGGRCAEWLRLTKEGYRPIPGRVATIETIFRMACNGYGILRIVQWLNEHKVEHPPFSSKSRPRDKEGNARPAVWLRPYVRKILRGRTVLGEFQPHRVHSRNDRVPEGEPIANYFPAVIDEDTWRLAQAAITGRRRRSGPPGKREANLFTGIVHEARTRLPMSMDGRSGNLPGQAAYRYLVAYQKGPSCTNGHGIPYLQFESGVLRRIGQLTARDVMPADVTQDAREERIQQLTVRIIALDHRVGEIQRQIEEPDNTAAVPALAKSLTRIATEKAETAQELEKLKLESLTGRGEALAETQSLLDLLATAEGTPEEEILRHRLKTSLRWMVDEIWLLVQPISKRSYIGHAQIYLRSGERRYVQLPPANLRAGVVPWDLAEADFREGDLGDAAKESAELCATG